MYSCAVSQCDISVLMHRSKNKIKVGAGIFEFLLEFYHNEQRFLKDLFVLFAALGQQKMNVIIIRSPSTKNHALVDVLPPRCLNLNTVAIQMTSYCNVRIMCVGVVYF